ncbi:hypothetical protein CDV31_011948 [Fusarium ambrosium]|uniref:Uncharacterized protein n=1 Tax=Fusarium ambrosium TaxID=131363 RepID=A0A428TD78_9HYPO|nr:hypothetical protein CDV31_011948 [Fusarium ambrosium]
MPQDYIPREKEDAIAPGVRALKCSREHRTSQGLVDHAHAAIEAVEVQLEENKRLASIASRIKGKGSGWNYELEHRKHLRSILDIDREVEKRCLFRPWFSNFFFIEDFAAWVDGHISQESKAIEKDITAKTRLINASNSSKLPAVRSNEHPSLTDERGSQLQNPQQADVPSLMASYSTMNHDAIRNEALYAMVVLGKLFRRVKAALVLVLPHFGNKDMEMGAKLVLQQIIIDLFDYGHDMWLLRRYVDRLQGLRHQTTKFEAGKFDRATARFADRLKYQLSSLERIASRELHCSIRPRDGPRPTIEETMERAMGEAMAIFDAKYLRNRMGMRDMNWLDGKRLDDWKYDKTLLCRLHRKFEDWDDRQDLFQTLGQDFVEAVFEGACDLFLVGIPPVKETTVNLRQLLDQKYHTPL